MSTQVFLSASPDETVRIGEAFAREYLAAGVVVALRGELGAGKTHFVKGIARALGIPERELTSPTFSLAHEFDDCELNGEPFTLYHLDAYRFERPSELLELGVEDFLYPVHAATIIEWPERVGPLLPTRRLVEVLITATSESERRITIDRLP